MTPDEVVNGLLNLRKEVLGIDETAKNKFSIYNSAITFIQDYQKLRERIEVGKIRKSFTKATDSNLTIEQAQAIVTYLQQPTD